MRDAVAKAEREVLTARRRHEDMEKEVAALRMRQVEDFQRHKEEVDKLHQSLEETNKNYVDDKQRHEEEVNNLRQRLDMTSQGWATNQAKLDSADAQIASINAELARIKADEASTTEKLRKLEKEAKKTESEMELKTTQTALQLTTQEKEEALRVKEVLGRQVLMQFEEIKMYTAQKEDQMKRIAELSAGLNAKTKEQAELEYQNKELENLVRAYREEAFKQQEEAYAAKAFNDWCCKFDKHVKTAVYVVQTGQGMLLRWRRLSLF
jgi:DNA repair exonuclease SbcCD ATPase subunit